VCGIFIAVVYIKLYGFFCPFKEDDDDILQEMAQFQVFITLFISLLIRDGTYPRIRVNYHSLMWHFSPQTESNCIIDFCNVGRTDTFRGHNWNRALDISLVVANLATSGAFIHSLFTARNYYVDSKDKVPSEKKTEGGDTAENVWGAEGEEKKADQQRTVAVSTV
jgi:hypothetical protein